MNPEIDPQNRIRICNAFKCRSFIPVKRIFCDDHWKMLPRKLQMDIFKNLEIKTALQVCIEEANDQILKRQKSAT